MCKYPIKIYRRPDPKDTTPIWKDDGNPYYLVPCGRCLDCIRRRKNDWYVRARAEKESGLYRQILWLSFTFKDSSLPETRADISAKIRAFKDRLRKSIGYFPVHFFISERGGKDQDGRIHLHGLLFLRHEVRYDVIRHHWADFEGYCWIEPIRTCRAITYCFKYAFKGIHQRLKGDNLTGYVWASLGFGDRFSAKRVMSWFCPADNYTYIKGITYDSRFHYAVPRYLIGKVIKLAKFKKMCSWSDLVKRTFDLWFGRNERVREAVALGLYIPKTKTNYLHESVTNKIYDTWSYSPQSESCGQVRCATGCYLPFDSYPDATG